MLTEYGFLLANTYAIAWISQLHKIKASTQ